MSKKHRKSKKRTAKKSCSTHGRKQRASAKPGYSQELLLLAAAVCAVGSFLVGPPWSGVLMIGAIIFFVLIVLNMKYNKKLRRHMSKLKPVPLDSAAEANALMKGLDHKNHYSNLPEEVREKSLFGKREGS